MVKNKCSETDSLYCDKDCPHLDISSWESGKCNLYDTKLEGRTEYGECYEDSPYYSIKKGSLCIAKAKPNANQRILKDINSKLDTLIKILEKIEFRIEKL